MLQYACEDHPFMTGLRDGITTNRIPTNQSLPNIMTFGQHENAMYYDRCRTRERNKGLFLADQVRYSLFQNLSLKSFRLDFIIF